MKSLKIALIEIVNQKSLRSFSIDLGGENLEIAGDTGSGKTTAASALWSILEKGKDQVTHGHKSGHIQVTLEGDGGTLICKRKHAKAGSSSIVIEAEDGRPVGVKDLKKMISQLSVNPHEIMKKGPTEQVALLMQAADIGDVDLDALDDQITQAAQDRTLCHRAITNTQPTGDKPERVEEVDVTGLIAEQKAIGEKRQRWQNNRSRHNSNVADLEHTETKITQVEARITELQAELTTLNADKIKLEGKKKNGLAYFDKNPWPSDEHITEQLTGASETNAKAAVYNQWLEDKKRHQKAKDSYANADQKVGDLREWKKQLLESAKWPLEGLSIQDGSVLYNGDLLENLGESKQSLVCSALAIQDILAHPIRVVRLDGCERMSKNDFLELQSLFNEHGIQVISTRVARNDEEDHEIVIEEGVYES